MSPLLAFVISLVVAGILGWITARLDKKEHALGGIMAIVVACSGGLISIYMEMGHLKADIEGDLRRYVPILNSEIWNSVVQDIADYDSHEPKNKFNATLDDPLRKNIETTFLQATNGAIEVDDQADVVRITSDLMDEASNTILATSYIDPKEWWTSSIGDNYFNKIQNTKKHVPKFARLFIFGSTEEARELAPLLQRQKAIGLDIRYVCASNIEPSMRRDFIVIDDQVAANLALDDQRHFKLATFYSTQEEAENFDRVFHDLELYAAPFELQKVIHCPSLPTEELGKSER